MAEELVVLAITGDDSQLRATLEKDKALVAAAATKMQASMKPLVVGQAEVATSAGAAAAGISTLAAAATVTGVASISTAANIGTLGVAMVTQTLAAKSASGAILKLTASLVLLAATPAIAALLAITAVLGASIFLLFKYKSKADEATEALQKTVDVTTAIEERGTKAIESASNALAILKGEADKFTFLKIEIVDKEILRDLEAQTDAIKAATKAEEERAAAGRKVDEERVAAAERIADAEKSAEESTEARRESLRQQLAILKGLAVATDFIADGAERRLAIELEVLRTEKQRAQAAKASLEASERRLEALRSIEDKTGQGKQIRFSLTALGGLGGSGSKVDKQIAEAEKQTKLARLQLTAMKRLGLGFN